MTGNIHKLRVDHQAALRQTARAITAQARPMGRSVTPELEQAVVVSVDGGTPPTCTIQYDTVTPGPVVPLVRYMLPPAAGDVVYVARLAGDVWVLGKLSMDPGTRFLNETHSTAQFTHTTGAATTMLSLAVTVPAGLPPGTRVRVLGNIGHMVTPAGVGVTAAITNAAGGQDVVTAGGVGGGLTVIRYDADPPAGSRTYTFTIATTVPGNTVTARYPQLEAVVL